MLVNIKLYGGGGGIKYSTCPKSIKEKEGKDELSSCYGSHILHFLNLGLGSFFSLIFCNIVSENQANITINLHVEDGGRGDVNRIRFGGYTSHEVENYLLSLPLDQILEIDLDWGRI